MPQIILSSKRNYPFTHLIDSSFLPPQSSSLQRYVSKSEKWRSKNNEKFRLQIAKVTLLIQSKKMSWEFYYDLRIREPTSQTIIYASKKLSSKRNYPFTHLIESSFYLSFSFTWIRLEIEKTNVSLKTKNSSGFCAAFKKKRDYNEEKCKPTFFQRAI